MSMLFFFFFFFFFFCLKPFRPSIIMKKWLNIKPKVHDFSEDEVDTETDSEDDGGKIVVANDSTMNAVSFVKGQDYRHQGDNNSGPAQRTPAECPSRTSGNFASSPSIFFLGRNPLYFL
ncbi:hypothetical protein SAY86_022573 [Trapa natans]|uniref:Uncharacterized protein n=1 Tax=Trapa natans TaxID=22666 RepID=A0AAN7RAS6_TRANT|nr:hypothetical protein SAY86_022573 [Trapa natans]